MVDTRRLSVLIMEADLLCRMLNDGRLPVELSCTSWISSSRPAVLPRRGDMRFESESPLAVSMVCLFDVLMFTVVGE